jgi:uncharacterized protein (TIGR00369 family)
MRREGVLVNDDPGNRCFGCSPHNDRGLNLTFQKTGPGSVECHYTVSEHFCGAEGVIHGGIQAALLDEAMGMAAHAGSGDERLWIATAEFSLRYRRPAPVGVPIRVRGRLVRVEGRDFYVEGEILDPNGERVTVADARWRQIDPPAGSRAGA